MSSSKPNTGSLKQRQEAPSQVRHRDTAATYLSGSGGNSGDLFVSGSCSRELSPVRWCDHEVDGVYLGRSGWVQVQQKSLDDRRINYSNNTSTSVGTLPIPRRTTVKLADYHCSKSEPGKCPDFSRLESQRPDYLALHGRDYDPPSNCSSPHDIPESFSPPSLTPIISPPPAFQDVGRRYSSRHNHNINYGKAPFLPRSNAIVDSDTLIPPPSPPLHMNWSSLPSSGSKKKTNPLSNKFRKTLNPTPVMSQQQQRLQQQYRMAQAKSLEDQSSSRRSQFAERYLESSSSSSSSMGFRSLDSCVNRTTMPKLSENTDSSVEGYDEGDEDDVSTNSPTIVPLHSSSESIRANGERISPGSRQNRHYGGQHSWRKSPGSSESGKQMSFNSSSSSTSSSSDRQGRSPTPNFRRSNTSRQQLNSRNITASPDSLQSRVRRSRSLQLPEKKSPGSSGPQQSSRETNDTLRIIKGNDRSGQKKHALPNSMLYLLVWFFFIWHVFSYFVRFKYVVVDFYSIVFSKITGLLYYSRVHKGFIWF